MNHPRTDPTELRPWPLVLLLLLAIAPLGAGATTFQRLSLERMTALSSHAVTARCMSLESRWDEGRTTILTRADFDVETTLHGDLTPQRISVYLPGGTVGEESVLVIGAPEIEVGDEMVLMLDRASPQAVAAMPLAATGPAFRLVGLSQGVFAVERDAATGEVRAVSSALPMFPREGLAADELPPGGADGMPLAELEERIRAASRLEGGAGR